MVTKKIIRHFPASVLLQVDGGHRVNESQSDFTEDFGKKMA